jgi:hypothetical protein
VQAAKVWFLMDGELLCFERSDSRFSKPQYDTFGGTLEFSDQGSYARCVIREVKEEVTLPLEWVTKLTKIVERYPNGHKYVEFWQTRYPPTEDKAWHQVAMWVVRISSKVRAYGGSKAVPVSTWAVLPGQHKWAIIPETRWPAASVGNWAVLTESGRQEVRANSLAFRPLLSVIENLQTFQTFEPLAKTLVSWMRDPSCTHQLLSLVCMHDVLQEAGYAMLFPFKSDEATAIWAGLGFYDSGIPQSATEWRWVVRLSLFRRWSAVSKSFGKSSQFRQIQAEVAVLYRKHRDGKVEEGCDRLNEVKRAAESKLGEGYRPLQTMVLEGLNSFSTFHMLNTKQDPNRTSVAWLVGSGFPVPLDLKKSGWQALFEVARPGVRLMSSDHGIS